MKAFSVKFKRALIVEIHGQALVDIVSHCKMDQEFCII